MGTVNLLEIMESVGNFGRFQKIMFLLLGLPFTFNVTVVYWMHYFVLITPPHHCTMPGINNTEVIKTLIPMNSEGQLDSCKRYDYNVSMVQQMDQNEAESYLALLKETGALRTIPCDYGWDYDTSNDLESVITDFDWVCDDEWKKFMSQTVFSVGQIIGLLLFGYLSDVYGRYPILVIVTVISPSANLALVVSHNFYVFCALRFVMGMVEYTMLAMPFFILMEYLPTHVRSMVTPIMFGVFACVGNLSMPWIYRYISNWKSILMYISMFMYVTSLPALHLIPESASWLLIKGRVDKFLLTIERIAKFNRKELPDKEKEIIRNQMTTVSENVEEAPDVSMSHVLKNKVVCLLTVIGIMLSMISNLLNDGNTRNTELVDMSPYVMFTLYASVMFPSLMICGFLMNRFGRKPTLVLGYTGCAVINALILFLPEDILSSTIRIILMVCFRAFDILCYSTTTTYLTEVMPTVIRARAVSLITCAASLSLAIGPQIIFMAKIYTWIPSLVFTSVSVLGALLTFCLPETKGAPLAQTLEDASRRGLGGIFCKKTEEDSQLKPRSESYMPPSSETQSAPTPEFYVTPPSDSRQGSRSGSYLSPPPESYLTLPSESEGPIRRRSRGPSVFELPLPLSFENQAGSLVECSVPVQLSERRNSKMA